MILANYAQQNRSTVRELGIGFTNPMAQFRPGQFLSFYTPNTTLDGLDKSAFNNGYNTHHAWQLPLKSGGIGSTGNINGTGGAAGTALAVKLAQAAIGGSGSLAATGGLIVQALAALSGSGGINSASLGAYLAAVASLTGSGTISSATARGLGALLADLTGSGTAEDSILTGIGELTGDITVTGTGLSTANVGDAVWAHVIESGFTAEQVMQIIAAVIAGKVSGGPGSPVFRNLPDTADRVSGTADSDGNRTDATYTPD